MTIKATVLIDHSGDMSDFEIVHEGLDLIAVPRVGESITVMNARDLQETATYEILDVGHITYVEAPPEAVPMVVLVVKLRLGGAWLGKVLSA